MKNLGWSFSPWVAFLVGVRFGSVEVVIQDSRVVQIERKEKFRFDKAGRG